MEAGNVHFLSSACEQGSTDVVDPRFLGTALLMSKLSAAVFDVEGAKASVDAKAQHAISPVANQTAHLDAVFNPKHSSLQTDLSHTLGKLGSQYAVWEVDGLGVVLALKSCPNLQDELEHINCESSAVQSEPDIRINSSMNQAAQLCCQGVTLACQELCCAGTAGPRPLFITGISMNACNHVYAAVGSILSEQ